MALKYSILLPYHRRDQQLRCTLLSFKKHYAERRDYEVIIVEDRVNKSIKSEHHSLIKIIAEFKDIDIRWVRGVDYECYNPAPQFNLAATAATGEFLVLSNPECTHYSNILGGFDQEFETENKYVVCACLSVRSNSIDLNQSLPKGTWYQNTKHRNAQLHFCSAINKAQFEAIGGFDNQYAKGMCFEDDDFRNKITAAGIPVVCRDDLISVHLQHNKSKPPHYLELHQINKKYYESKWGPLALKAENMGV